MRYLIVFFALITLLFASFQMGMRSQAKVPINCEKETGPLQEKINQLIVELRSQKATLAEIYEKLLKLLFVEIGLRLKPSDLEYLFPKAISPTRKSSYQSTQSESTSTELSMAKDATSSEKKMKIGQSKWNGKSKIPSIYYKFQDKILFGIPSLFEGKKDRPITNWEDFKMLQGHYIGLVSFDDNTEGIIEMDFKQGAGPPKLSLILKNSLGRNVIDIPYPGNQLLMMSLGLGEIPSVGEVQTAAVITGKHKVVFAWPLAPDIPERSDGAMLEGHYYFQDQHRAQLYLFRK